jgi:hypothetical protein
MSVSLTDVRFQIQDQPRSFGVAPESPRALGQADGAMTTFYLPLGRGLQYVAGSAQLSATPIGGTAVGIAGSAYTITQQGLVAFTAAPGSGTSPAIAIGSVIGAAFQATAFSDADLTGVLARAVDAYGEFGDAFVLRGCSLEIIGVLLTNVEKLALIREAEYERDPAAVIAALSKQQTELRTQLSGQPRPNQAQPALLMHGGRLRPYQPVR